MNTVERLFAWTLVVGMALWLIFLGTIFVAAIKVVLS